MTIGQSEKDFSCHQRLLEKKQHCDLISNIAATFGRDIHKRGEASTPPLSAQLKLQAGRPWRRLDSSD